ncbi:unnamed protein product [Rotaria sp. Silwood2]|nr:unnamed protein product [Rotaria sp. Silwood2]
MALHLLEATLTQGPSCSADDIAELEIHVRTEIERYVQLEIERELYELVQSTTSDTLLTPTICSTYLSNGEINNETSKKRIKIDSDTAKASAKTNMELDQQLTELKNKYLTVNFQENILKNINSFFDVSLFISPFDRYVEHIVGVNNVSLVVDCTSSYSSRSISN